jgi:hypothetical protein
MQPELRKEALPFGIPTGLLMFQKRADRLTESLTNGRCTRQNTKFKDNDVNKELVTLCSPNTSTHVLFLRLQGFPT